MNNLAYPLTRIAHEGVAIDETLTSSDLRPDEKQEIALGDITIRGVLEAVNGEIVFNGSVRADYKFPCDRCLVEGVYPSETDVVWRFKEEMPDDHPEDNEDIEFDHDDEQEDQEHPFDGETIDLAKSLWEEVVLDSPSKHLCNKNCKGLCPQCGANLNTQTCACKDKSQKGGSGLSALADMFPDLSPTED